MSKKAEAEGRIWVAALEEGSRDLVLVKSFTSTKEAELWLTKEADPGTYHIIGMIRSDLVVSVEPTVKRTVSAGVLQRPKKKSGPRKKKGADAAGNGTSTDAPTEPDPAGQVPSHA